MSEEGLRQALATLRGVDLGAVSAEVDNLLAIKAWAISSLRLGYGVGDRVQIISPEPAATAADRYSGWHRYREALRIGQPGIVREISFSGTFEKWLVLVAMDRAWSTPDEGTGGIRVRHWYGPEGECPEGFGFSNEKVKCFSFDAHWVGQ